MISYFLRRLLLFFPTLIIISIAAFYINKMAPGDPVDRNTQSITGAGNKHLDEQRLAQKKIWRKKLGLDLPVFYFQLRSFDEPDTLFKIYPPSEKLMLEKMYNLYGNWPAISNYYSALKNLEYSITSYESTFSFMPGISSEDKEKTNTIKFECRTICNSYNSILVPEKLNLILDLIPSDLTAITLKEKTIALKNMYNRVTAAPSNWKKYIPVVSFHSMNQYHRWIFGDGNWLTGNGAVFSKGIIRGDFGTSFITGLPVMQEIKPRILCSMIFAFISILVVFLISIPIGIYSASHEHKIFDKISGMVMFFLYSLPLFWVATVLLMLFSNPDTLQLFPSSGIMPDAGYPEGSSLLSKIRLSLPYFILPVICYSYNAIAFITRSLRISMLNELKEHYIQTARAKGVDETKIVLGHAFRNSLLPLITLLANILPISIAGSLIIETIFSIPGMGRETIYAIQHQNYPVIIAIFTITGFMTLTSYLIADFIYIWADPRISFVKNRP